ncbi:hypothetical protein BK816_01690 [Boudabousia tangfeifanii]|uniref:Ascorbate-specific PTS system EIIC component n=1 Tax=Boudabousia tangfeifanii TaxID=1912795 RepID=A0A1D9MIY4_9ACTO|nr:PTS ascorbate transporter subunit IIC [Boudabousia tangfeifanii]AOZ72168.1 hypothetical protein BK816_01690 [Boudabousia tangfeifanii]
MAVLNVLLALVQVPAIIIGFIALLGLLLQKKDTSAVVTGTVKTILSVLIITGGITVLISALGPIQGMFELALPKEKVTTFVTFDEAVVGAVQSANEANLGMLIGLTLLFGYITHLVISRITKHRYVYLTGHMIWVHAGGFAILFHSLGLGPVATVVIASLVDGAYMTFAPALAQPFMRKITGRDDIGFAHGQTTLNVAFGWIAKFIGNPKKSTEEINVPKSLNFFRDVAVSTTAVMLVVTYIAAIGAVITKGVDFLQNGNGADVPGITGGQNWVIFSLVQALTFTAGMLIMLYGVRMLIAEIVPAFQGVGMKMIPGAKPALDVPVIFPFAPNALVIGLIFGFIGQIAGMGVLAAMGWPMPIPSVIVAFFACGAGAIFANAMGGARGAIFAAFSWGFFGWLLISAAYHFQSFGNLDALGATALGFTVPDLVIPGLIVGGLKALAGPWVAAIVPVVAVLATVALTFNPSKELPKWEKPADKAATK